MSGLPPLFEAEWADPDHFELYESVEALAQRAGWEAVLTEAMGILADAGSRRFWHQAICVVYWSSPDHLGAFMADHPMDCVARLYLCLERHPELDENLIWSIACRLKGVDYLSSWNPLLDRDVVARMAVMSLAK